MPQMDTRQRRRMMNWYFTHDKDIAATCAQFGVSRATLYRWLARHAATPEKPLRVHSRRPHTIRGPAWSREELVALCQLTMEHPRWGRGRLTTALTAQAGIVLSPATVGRMLAWICARCPICGKRDGCHNPALHAQDQDFVQHGVSMPLRPVPPDPEK